MNVKIRTLHTVHAFIFKAYIGTYGVKALVIDPLHLDIS
jgi:hypothetical protein